MGVKYFSLELFTVALCLIVQDSQAQDIEYPVSNTQNCQQETCCLPFDPAQLSDEEINGYFKEGSNIVAERAELEQKLVNEGYVVVDGQADLTVLRRKTTDPATHQYEMKQLAFNAVTDKLAQKYCMTDADFSDTLPYLKLRGPDCRKAKQVCEQGLYIGDCDSTFKYRTPDGTCNNLDNPSWGSNGVCFRRILPARYVGSSGFRQSVLGGDLPNPRILSLNIHNNLNRPTNYVNHMYMFFGQLLDHDLVQTPFSTTMDNQAIECCTNQNEVVHPQCAPIMLPEDDPFYSRFDTQCMNFVRSSICPTCVLGSRQQINQITAYIDASFVYGNSLNETNGLRANDGSGRLRVERTSVGDLMPSSPNPRSDLCSFVNTSDICFEAGDSRANQHRTLASLHTVFVREHNRLADGLRRLNPRWNGERIFQEARRIVGAEMQVITYKEFLPATLGRERMTFFSLWISDYSTQYDDSVDPTLYTEFSTAAFRFGHSLINSIVTQGLRGDVGNTRLLRDEFFQPFDLRNGIIGPLLQGVSRAPAQWFDRNLVEDVTNFLYRVRNQPTGLDLAAINIQRGRDHGLPSYSQMVEYCSSNQFTIRRFSDLVNNNIMTSNNMELLRRYYRDVRDIDLWTGILAERYNEDSVIGPTGICIVGMQFNRLKFGDRFYFQHRNQAGSFSYQQIQELKKVTLSQIICANTDATSLPMNAMLFRSRNNPDITCRYVNGLDLSYWRY